MRFNTIPEALEDLRQGKIILVTDDPERENEGDFICAAEFATTENVNFMATHGKGLICMPMSEAFVQKLKFPQMVRHNTDNHETAFTVSIDHISTTTGISAAERSITALACVAEDAKAEDFRRPGHMFPLLARKNGVLERNGHTEATVDLCRLAGLKECGLCCEIMRDDGTMMRTEELAQLAERFQIKFITIQALQEYRKCHEKLGDVLLQVALHTRMEEEQGAFTFGDVCTGICKKLIYRHPHIFGDAGAQTPDEALQNWEALKRREKHREGAGDDLDSVPAALPALMRSRKVAKRAADHGFTYPDAQAAIADLEQELTELKQAVAQGSADAQQEELGDVLFSAANVSRFLDCDAEEALDAATVKFVRRFREMERLAAQQGCAVDDLSAAELDKLWKRAKEVFTKR